ncbi:hypothetical protein [Corallococcus sp. RDP092CA]|uniref:hypothetical protein n=1 Tax=Corallococcus sp. RDP092CA TaxID=3109369 RepID=UPI0035B4D4EB
MTTFLTRIPRGQMMVIELQNPTLRLNLGKSPSGAPQPQLDIIVPRDSNPRRLSGTLLAFAANLELNTPARERWTVKTERVQEPNHGRVYLELAEGDAAEAKRGMMLLGRLRGYP